jgi:hypothetical protein
MRNRLNSEGFSDKLASSIELATRPGFESLPPSHSESITNKAAVRAALLV